MTQIHRHNPKMRRKVYSMQVPIVALFTVAKKKRSRRSQCSSTDFIKCTMHAKHKNIIIYKEEWPPNTL